MIASARWLVEHAKEVGHEFALLTVGGFAYVTLHTIHHKLSRYVVRLVPKRLRRGGRH